MIALKLSYDLFLFQKRKPLFLSFISKKKSTFLCIGSKNPLNWQKISETQSFRIETLLTSSNGLQSLLKYTSLVVDSG